MTGTESWEQKAGKLAIPRLETEMTLPCVGDDFDIK